MNKLILLCLLISFQQLSAKEIQCEVKRVNAQFKKSFVLLKQKKDFTAHYLSYSEEEFTNKRKLILSSSDFTKESIIEEYPGVNSISLKPSLNSGYMVVMDLKFSNQTWPINYRLTFDESPSSNPVSSTLWLEVYSSKKKIQFKRLADLICSLKP